MLKKRCGSLWGTMTEQKSFPVKYMAVRSSPNSEDFDIIDTLSEYAEIMCVVPNSLRRARMICKLLNEAEGYRYDLS